MGAPPFRLHARFHAESGLWVQEASRPDPGEVIPRWIGRLRRWWSAQGEAEPENELLEPHAAVSLSPVRFVPVLVGPIVLVPALVVAVEPQNRLALWSVLLGMAVLAYASLAAWVERRRAGHFGLQVVNAVVFTAAITGLLGVYALLDHPRSHAHWIVFFLYTLLIGATGLADDPRVCVCTGALTIVGYLALVPVVLAAASTGASTMAAQLAPEFEWVANASKVALLVGTTVTATASAARGRALRRMSLRDGLTGLLNRRAFDACLDRLAERARRAQRPLSIAMIDLDHFKELNDGHGHALGDAVLRWLASVLRRGVRTTDVAARYGGEEFVIAFVDSDDERLADRLEALRARVAAAHLRLRPGDEPIGVSVSIGVASLPGDGERVEEVLARADERLYQAKRDGRNRLVDGRAAA